MPRSGSGLRKTEFVPINEWGKYVFLILHLPKWALDFGAAVRYLGGVTGLLHPERDQGGEAGASP